MRYTIRDWLHSECNKYTRYAQLQKQQQVNKMGYYINLEKISIDNYKEILITANLLPSRIILKNNIEDNFKLIKKQKITNLQELFDTLKTKKKLLY